MHTEYLKNGKVKFIEYYKDPYSNKRLKKSINMDKDTSQNRNKARRHLNELIENALSKKSKESITIEKLFNLFYDDWVISVRPTSVRTYRSVDRRILSMFPKDCLVENIDRRLLQEIANDLYQFGFSNESLKKHYSRLKQIYSYGVRQDYITNNEIEHVVFKTKKMTREQLDEKEMNYLTVDEARKIINYFKSRKDINHYYRILTILFYTGMRIGELFGLKEENVDVENKTIKIVGSYDYVEKKKGDTKTVASYRKIDVNDEVIKMIQETLISNQQRFSEETLSKNEEKYIFISETGMPQTGSSFDYTLKRTAWKLGFDRNISCHTFRHTHISILAEMRIPLKAIMQRVGHVKSDTTTNIYTHVTENMKNELVEKLENYHL